MKHALAVLVLMVTTSNLPAVAPPNRLADPALASRAQAILKTHCYRCHGQDGAVEGGLNYILDRDKLITRRKIVPGQPERSPVFVRTLKGKMPPPDEKVRPSAEEITVLRRWIAEGAASTRPPVERSLISETVVQEWILHDLEQQNRRSRRFLRYFSLVPLANAGAGDDELKTYRNALAKLINSLSWHPRISIPQPIDPRGLVLRIDLRDYLLDANLWNRLLNDYPYGILHDTGVARAVLVATATRMPVVRADWFVATASRAPLYYDLLQMPSNLSELERQLRVDVALNIQQERVARAGFNGSGISRNNRILERHDAMNGAYWRTYDFEAVPQNLIERNLLLPDRRNIFAYPLGPGSSETQFQHAGGEAIFNLPNGLQGYILVNVNNQRINKGPTEIVSDPKRPDRAVEAGLSCMHCHARGIIPKDDQLREHVRKNRKAFSRTDADLVEALYPPAKKMRQLMDEDARRFQKAVEKTGNKTTAAEVILAMTLRYEADLDLPTLAAEAGVPPEALLPRLTASENLAKNLGALKVPGGTVSRQVVVQAFADLVREMKLGGVLDVGRGSESLPDATGEVDPLETQSSPANALAFSPDGKRAAFASNDKSVRIFDIEAGRDLRRCIGHTASVWCVAFSPDGSKLLSGSKDGTLRLWDVETARELQKIDAHLDFVSALAFSPDGKRALSAGYDHEVILWDLGRGERVSSFTFREGVKYIHSLAFSPDAKSAILAAERSLYQIDARTGNLLRKLEGHTGWIVHAAFSRDGKSLVSASDDGTARLWDVDTGKQIQLFRGHNGPVKSASLRRDGRLLLTGGADTTVRLWDVTSGKELRSFRKHSESLVAVVFGPTEAFTLSGSRDALVHPWKIDKVEIVPPRPTSPPVKHSEAQPFRPLATISVGGTIGGLVLSPDRGSLYYLNRTDGVLGRINLTRFIREAAVTLPESDVIALSADGKTLVARAGRGNTTLRVIDPLSLKIKASYRLDLSSYDLTVRDDGVVFLTGNDAEWSQITLVEASSGKQLGAWSGVWGKALVRLTTDGRRLYASSQGVVPGTLDAFVVPLKLTDRPTTYRAPDPDKFALGGGFILTPDGRYLINKTGTVLRLSADRDEDLRFHARIEPHLSATIEEASKRAYLIDRDGDLRIYYYPEFRLLGRHRLALAAYAVVVDGKAGRLYVAGFDPRSLAERPRARAYGDIHVYAIPYPSPPASGSPHRLSR
jgi:WD40 repeat protein